LPSSVAVLAVPLTWAWKLHTGTGLDLTPSMHWPEPVVAADVEIDAGPVLVSVHYVVDSENRDAFLRAVDRVGCGKKARRRVCLGHLSGHRRSESGETVDRLGSTFPADLTTLAR
jgi:Transmembrane secretion effector